MIKDLFSLFNHDYFIGVAEFISRLAQVHGPMVKIDLAATNNPLNRSILPYCKFLANINVLKGLFFSYDRVNSSLHFREYMEVFSELSNTNISDLVHRETPATNH